MEDDIDYGRDMTFEELNSLEKANIEFDKNIGHVKEGICPHCHEEFVNMVEHRNVGNLFTLHFNKLKCFQCDEEYLDLDNAERYDLLLMLEKAFKQPLDVLSKKVEKLI